MNRFLLDLAGAKFPPEQTPALLEDMLAVKDQVITVPGKSHPLEIHSAIQASYHDAINALIATKEQLSLTKEYDTVLVDQDLDSAGYGIFEIVEGKERVASSKQVPLSDSLQRRLEDIRLVRGLFRLDTVEGRAIFSLSFYEEYNALKIVLSRAEAPEAKAAIERLGLSEDFERLSYCCDILRRLLGIGKSEQTSASEGPFIRFSKAAQQLIFAVGLYASEDTEAHRKIRALVLGPYEKHVVLFREHRKKKAEGGKKKTEAPKENTDKTEDTFKEMD